jgi:YidC/Oxa1 family membrane protein insertase
MTVLINILILPVMAKSTIASQKMQMIQPELDQIQRKYAGRKDQTSQMRMSAEMQALYKKHDVSMLSSLSTFITLPIMFAMYHAVQRLEVLYQSTMFGLNLGDKPLAEITSGHFQYIAIIVLVGLTQYFAIEITNIMAKRNQRHPTARVSQTQKQMKQMNVMMTVMIVYFALSMPTAMSLYWITTNIVTLARTVLIQFLYMEKKQKK